MPSKRWYALSHVLEQEQLGSVQHPVATSVEDDPASTTAKVPRVILVTEKGRWAGTAPVLPEAERPWAVELSIEIRAHKERAAGGEAMPEYSERRTVSGQGHKVCFILPSGKFFLIENQPTSDECGPDTAWMQLVLPEFQQHMKIPKNALASKDLIHSLQNWLDRPGGALAVKTSGTTVTPGGLAITFGKNLMTYRLPSGHYTGIHTNIPDRGNLVEFSGRHMTEPQ